MSLVSFGTRSITIIRPTRILDHGSLWDDWSNPEPPRVVAGCVIQPGASTEENDRQDAQRVTYTVLAPEGTDILASDKVRVDGLDLAVLGRPRKITSPTGYLNHVQIELTDWVVT